MLQIEWSVKNHNGMANQNGIIRMANSIDPVDTAHYEPSHQDLHCLHNEPSHQDLHCLHRFDLVCSDERVKQITIIF